MSFIEVPLADAKEKTIQPEGGYELVIKKADIHKKEGTNSQSIRFIIGFDGVAEGADIFHYQGLPGPDDDDEKKNNKLVMMNQFLDRFSVPREGNGFATEDCLGARGRVFVAQEEDNNGTMRNVLKMGKKV